MAKKWKSTYAKQDAGRDVYSLALERIERLYQLFDTIVVMFSGGKDSTAVLNMVATVAQKLGKGPVKVIFWDEEAVSYEVEEYIRRTAARPDIDLTWYCVPIKHRNACSKESPYWLTWNPDEADLWVRELPPEAVTEIPGYDFRTHPLSIPDLSSIVLNDPKLGRVCQVLGIRAQEEFYDRYDLNLLIVGRRLADRNHVGDASTGVYTNGQGVTRYSPLRHWTHEDVLAVCAWYDLPMPPFYGWPNGWVVGTGCWPARQWTGSIQNGWAEIYQIDPSIVVQAAQHLQSAREFLDRARRFLEGVD